MKNDLKTDAGTEPPKAFVVYEGCLPTWPQFKEGVVKYPLINMLTVFIIVATVYAFWVVFSVESVESGSMWFFSPWLTLAIILGTLWASITIRADDDPVKAVCKIVFRRFF